MRSVQTLLCGGRLTGGRVLRGGSWNNNQRDARASIRNRNTPDNANNNNGFRVAAHVFSGKPRRQCSGLSSDDAGRGTKNGVTCSRPRPAPWGNGARANIK